MPCLILTEKNVNKKLIKIKCNYYRNNKDKIKFFQDWLTSIVLGTFGKLLANYKIGGLTSIDYKQTTKITNEFY